ncbi:hypothetical protein LBMAG48_18220 [Phycisphaerae bacterium]|jgi:hypothetical protein|nr:hypothetical protein LBMAG48_18220 [Phycisphaerae bacterium]
MSDQPVNPATIVNAAKNSSRGKRPLWMTVLLVLGAGVVWLLQQKGVLPQTSNTQQTNQQTSRQTGQSSGQSQSESTPSEPAPTQPHRAEQSKPAPAKPSKPDATPARAASDGGIADLFKKQQGDTWVEAEGTIKKILPDDNDTSDGSSKHQRWIVRVPTGIEILIAHAFDVSARVPVKEGDAIRFRGEYEYSEKGGTVHFTHAPKFKRRDPGGWIEHDGTKYE